MHETSPEKNKVIFSTYSENIIEKKRLEFIFKDFKIM